MLSEDERVWIIKRILFLIHEMINKSDDYRAKEIRELMQILRKDK